ncbi:hypothetical protein JEZ13_08515 [bacterium]|nr:hypothetical protein [bacterium]
MRSILTFVVVAIIMLTTACSEMTAPNSSENENYGNQRENVKIPEKKDYEKVVINPLVKVEGWKYPVSGTIEYWQNENLIATIDYGNGELDSIASKIVGGETHEIDLSESKPDYEKIITNPIVKVEGWDYPVAGTIEIFKSETLIATIDYGNGELDSIGTKTTDYGSYTFDMSKGK